MGLYLCVFDADGNEVEGVEIGSYGDFNSFRDAVTATVEKGVARSVCPILIDHSDCDGQWTSEEARALLFELEQAERMMSQYPAVEFSSAWKQQVAKTIGIQPATLLDSFFDVDGEPLVERLKQLAQASIEVNQPILFQ